MTARKRLYICAANCIGFLSGLCAQSGSIAQPTLRITSPAEGTVVAAGAMVTVTVEASPANAFQAVLIIADDISFSKIVTSPPYQFQVEMPQRIGRFILTADGITTPGHGATSESVDILVERLDVPVSLIPEYTRLVLSSVGVQNRLGITGVFEGGVKADLTESSLLQYSSDNPGVAAVHRGGVVTAIAVGTAMITVRYRGQSVLVPVTVNHRDK